ncbi:4Fe-4S binding protein [Shewanella yunxiaonensis]|uniref:4Fe-4S binding protein n=1 Tax=Shewanella yunxiaonensis TaxID=2829809 RepID=A0ABX7YYB8_9GAMM|nr:MULTISPECIES: 4Fe-4S binding protein [Shewanella]MDF0533433.1 4Fe-4S binding protein [Shewanella sp. A32]QUN07709.1 4Fe-4S binding protein [Shewanella yunxiaonensis]
MSNSPAQQALRQVRNEVKQQTRILQNLIPPTVSYTTEGSVLVIGPEDLARLAADKLSGMAGRVILANEPITSQDEAHLEKVMAAAEDVETYYNKIMSVKGFLGQFQVTVEHNEGVAELSKIALRKAHFDLILDLSQTPLIQLEMLPPGYFYVGQDPEKLAQALEELPQMVGQFDKPRYVKINADICAHYRNGINGCNRCLNFCPADAIKSVDQQIAVDPYLCHGAGSCSNACPTGALTYDLPTPQALHSYLNKLINRFIEKSGTAPVILFHDAAQGAALITDELPGDVLAVELEEITVAGMDHWFAALAWGARQVLIFNTTATAPSLTQMLQGELQLANTLLQEIGQPQRISLIGEQDLADLWPILDSSLSWPVMVPATFAADSKRATLFAALDYLNDHGKQAKQLLPMSNVPYGRVKVKTDDCTLCMSCVATCPTQALQDGGDKPALYFVEQDCVQCGLCEAACPEKVISLEPAINLDKVNRQQRQTLKEEAPFECIRCGAPFATQSMVHRMLEMVGTHSAFSANIERLKMCGDCRVKDMFEEILNDPEKQLR